MMASPAIAEPTPMPALAPVERSESLAVVEVADTPVDPLVGDVDVGPYDVEPGIDEMLPPVWRASARTGADSGTKLGRSEDCHATDIGFANATVTDASPGNCLLWICVQDHCSPLVKNPLAEN